MATEKKVIALKVTVDTSDVESNVERTTESVENLGEQTKKTSSEMKSGFKAAEQGTKGLGSSIGGLIKSLGIIGVAMAVFSFLKDILMKNQKVMDALSTATIAFEIIINRLFDLFPDVEKSMTSAFENPREAVIALWEFIKDNLLNRLEGAVLLFQAAGETIEAAFNLDWEAAKKGALDFGSALIQATSGFDREQQEAFIDGVVEFANEVATATVAAVKQADALTKLRNEVALLEASQQKIQLGFQREAELQRQARDDIRLTIAERIAANDKLGEILKDQIKVEEERVNKTLLLRQLELNQLGENTERLAAVAVAEGAVAELRERIVSQESEQLTNQAALQKELFDIQQELRVATLDARKKELEELDIYYEALIEKARLASQSSVEIEAAKIKAVAELKDKFLKEDQAKQKAANDAILKEEKRIADAKVALAKNVGSVLGSIQSLVNQQSKEGVIAAKALAVAQIAIDTAVAITGAIAQAQSVPYPGNLVAIATGVAAVVAGIASAVTTLNTANIPGGSASAPPNASAAIAGAAAAPSFNPVTTNTTELGGTEQAELAPIQAFVVETQITGSQENVNQIEGQATFGGG